MTIAHTSHSPLERARKLTLPKREDVLQRTPAVQLFWDNNRDLLTQAWTEWENLNRHHSVPLNTALLDSRLRETVLQAWEKPSAEVAVRELWKEVAPGVFQSQFFDPERLSDLRTYLENAASAQIPLRPPYGIVLNRNGAMLDQRSDGYLAAPQFQKFYRELLDIYMRPIARLLFPEVMGYDTQTFGFSIEYQAGMDTSLRLHTDASSVTLNINLNVPGEEFTGSELDYYDPSTGNITKLSFQPGVAMIHRGSVPHAAHAITSGTRTNLVLWLYGDHGQTPPYHSQNKNYDADQRWAIPATIPDSFAPF